MDAILWLLASSNMFCVPFLIMKKWVILYNIITIYWARGRSKQKCYTLGIWYYGLDPFIHLLTKVLRKFFSIYEIKNENLVDLELIVVVQPLS